MDKLRWQTGELQTSARIDGLGRHQRNKQLCFFGGPIDLITSIKLAPRNEQTSKQKQSSRPAETQSWPRREKLVETASFISSPFVCFFLFFFSDRPLKPETTARYKPSTYSVQPFEETKHLTSLIYCLCIWSLDQNRSQKGPRRAALKDALNRTSLRLFLIQEHDSEFLK